MTTQLDRKSSTEQLADEFEIVAVEVSGLWDSPQQSERTRKRDVEPPVNVKCCVGLELNICGGELPPHNSSRLSIEHKPHNIE